MTGWTLLPAALALLTFCIAAETVQQISFKLGAARAEAAPRFARAIVLEPLVWAGLLLWVIESIAWVLVLQRAPLSMAYPVMTLSYATVPVAGLVLLKERMTRRQILGAGLIFAGVVLVAAAGA
jgi:undecaprenyl phosphate-alpha-L-ara4N flippase subunit ArnE